MPLGAHGLQTGEIGGLAMSETAADLGHVGCPEMVEYRILPVRRSLALPGGAVLEDGALLRAVVAPTEGAALVDRVQRVDEDHGARQRQPRLVAAPAEPVQQYRLCGSGT